MKKQLKKNLYSSLFVNLMETYINCVFMVRFEKRKIVDDSKEI